MKSLLFLIAILVTIACGNAPKITDSQQSADNQEIKETNFKNPLVGVEWKINGSAFVNPDAESYTLTAPEEGKNKFPSFGHFVQFNEDGSFKGHYSAQCGNDCFTSVDGKYSMNSENQIKISITKASNHGFCNDTLLIENKEMGIFEIIAQKDKSFLLKKK